MDGVYASDQRVEVGRLQAWRLGDLHTIHGTRDEFQGSCETRHFHDGASSIGRAPWYETTGALGSTKYTYQDGASYRRLFLASSIPMDKCLNAIDCICKSLRTNRQAIWNIRTLKNDFQSHIVHTLISLSASSSSNILLTASSSIPMVTPVDDLTRFVR